MKAHITITAIVLASLLSGCGVKRDEHQRVVDDLNQAKQRLGEARQEMSEIRKTLASVESALAAEKKNTSRLETELQDSRARINDMTTEIDRLKKQDSYAFSEAGRRLDAADLAGALQAYRAFVRDFPSSPQVSAATTQIQQIEERLESQRREAAAQAESERQARARQELAERVRSGALTVGEWGPLLRGKTMTQVRELLGPPWITFDSDRAWGYTNRIIHPITEKPADLVIDFNWEGIVNSFSAGISGTKWKL